MLIQQLILLPINEGSTINEYSTAIIAIFTVLLAGITWYYARLTKQIVTKTDDSLKQTEEIIKQNIISHEQTDTIIKQTRTEKRIAFLEKKLEKLYYPLLDYLNSEEIAKYRCYWAYDPQTDEPSIDELANRSTIRYHANDVIPYIYLASDDLKAPLDIFLEMVREQNPLNWAADSPEFDQKIEDFKDIVKDDIKIIRDELNKLTDKVISIPDDTTDDEDKSYLDGHTKPSIQIIKEMLFNAYEAEWQRTHDIEHKASTIIGFVGIIFSLTIATLSTILVYTDETTRNKIFFSSIFSPIGIFLILSFMALSIFCGILTISVKEWKYPSANKFLEHCKEVDDESDILETVFENYKQNTVTNSNLNDKIAKYLKASHNLFLASLISLIIFILFIINSFN